MYCNQCGAPLAPDESVCSRCGHALVAPGVGARAASLAPPEGRVRRHRKLLAVLWIVRGALLLPGGLFLWFGMAHARFMVPRIAVGPGPFWGPSTFPALVPSLLGAIGIGLLIMGGLSILAGVALLQSESWARILAIVLGILELVSIPFGTALGIYTLWVLLPADSESEFRTLAAARGARA